jgi:uncharacterized protein YqfA (UPF0365 family)
VVVSAYVSVCECVCPGVLANPFHLGVRVQASETKVKAEFMTVRRRIQRVLGLGVRL